MRLEQLRRGAHWDSTLTVGGGEATLTLIFRLRTVQITPTSPSQGGITIHNRRFTFEGHTYNLLPWEMSEWEDFRNSLPGILETAWNGKLWLIPNQGWYQTNVREIAADYSVSCQISIQLTNANPHLTFYCVNPSELIRPNVRAQRFVSFADYNTRSGVISVHDTQTEIFRFASGDDRVPGRPTNITPYQTSFLRVAHEFGHIMNLGHVNEGRSGCILDTNARVCYGINEQQRDDIMGYGQDVRTTHIRPWKNTIVGHLRPEVARDYRLRWGEATEANPFVIHTL